MHSPVDAVLDNIISKLESTFGESLHIQDTQKSEHTSEEYDIDKGDLGEGNLCGGFEPQETKQKIKCLEKSSAFPYPDTFLASSSSDGEADTSMTESLSKQSPLQSHSSSLSHTAPPKLVSAMKGNREKQGGPKMKLTVKWAPDVYDPVPSLLSHTVKSKKQHKSRIKKNEKKNGKKGRKVSYANKGGSGKYKHNPNWWLESSDKVIEPSTEMGYLDDHNHDSYFGTSYLKKHVKESYCPEEGWNNILDFVSCKTA